MKEDDNGKQSWWASLPGILTGCAAVITAIVGYLAITEKRNIIEPVPVTTTSTIVDDPSTGKTPPKEEEKPVELDITIAFMEGNWKNYFGSGGAAETAKIDKGDYYVNDIRSFKIENFNYNKNTKEITFTKISTLDTRHLSNILKLESDGSLVGTESDGNVTYNVRYVKLPN